jgi:hypothetical protein
MTIRDGRRTSAVGGRFARPVRGSLHRFIVGERSNLMIRLRSESACGLAVATTLLVAAPMASAGPIHVTDGQFTNANEWTGPLVSKTFFPQVGASGGAVLYVEQARLNGAQIGNFDTLYLMYDYVNSPPGVGLQGFFDVFSRSESTTTSRACRAVAATRTLLPISASRVCGKNRRATYRTSISTDRSRSMKTHRGRRHLRSKSPVLLPLSVLAQVRAMACHMCWRSFSSR